MRHLQTTSNGYRAPRPNLPFSHMLPADQHILIMYLSYIIEYWMTVLILRVICCMIIGFLLFMMDINYIWKNFGFRWALMPFCCPIFRGYSVGFSVGIFPY